MICLNHDGTYKKINKVEKILKHKNEIVWYLIDISTKLKGPVYTISKTLSLDKINMIKILLTIVYNVEDCPYSDASTLHYTINIDTIEKFYSIYPLINQMMTYNMYRENFYLVSKDIIISNIEIEADNTIIEIDENDEDYMITKAFKRLNMTTSVYKLMGVKFIILDNKNHWYISKDIPDDFYKIGLHVIGTESLYLLSRKQFIRLSSIKSMTINIGYDIENDCKVYDDESYILEDNTIDCNSIEAILSTCMFFPQMMSLERAVYDVSSEITIDIDLYNGNNYHLSITEKEARNPIFLFDIINKIIQISNEI